MSEGLTLTDLTRIYRGQAAVAGVNLFAPAGAVTAVLGASGSGKSTLLRLIAGLEPVDAGEIAWGGQVVSRPGLTLAPERRRVGLVFQDYALFPHLRALQNVAFGLDRLPAEHRRAQALSWLARVGLDKKAHAYPHELSGGEQQRVALARALAPQPHVVLLDEPFSGLDPVLRGDLRELTRQVSREASGAFVFVTHDAQEALYMGDQIAVMAAGRVVQVGGPKALYARPQCLQAATALGDVNTFRGAVVGGALATPFGALATPGLTAGIEAVAAVRVEALRLVPGAGFQQVERRPQGFHDLVALRGADGETVWRGLVDAGVPETACWSVAIDAAGSFVFSA